MELFNVIMMIRTPTLSPLPPPPSLPHFFMIFLQSNKKLSHLRIALQRMLYIVLVCTIRTGLFMSNTMVLCLYRTKIVLSCSQVLYYLVHTLTFGRNPCSSMLTYTDRQFQVSSCIQISAMPMAHCILQSLLAVVVMPSWTYNILSLDSSLPAHARTHTVTAL